ncbi:MAG: ABC transporter ATP-binding protein [Chrysiogenales bacterium]|nr:ABC transporter ATP-binding protein [Candidatus Aminicenantes bacterium]TFG80050.1 MAG: ABC transporter ATP-binding protein [Chrysiogenales bacterium]
MIAIDKLSVRFGKVRAVDDLSLAIDKGESILLAGANGAGKTTLLRALAGVLRARPGSILYDGCPADHRSRKKIAYIPASISLYDGMTVKEAARMHAHFYGRSAAWTISEPAFRPGQKIASMSKGEKTIFFLSLALGAAPEYLFVDDVVHFLDPHLREVFLTSILRLIEEKQLTVIMASQSAFEIEGIPERVMVMEKGKVILDENVDMLKQKFIKFYGESIPEDIPVVFSRQWQNAREMYVYPYQAKVHHLDNVEHLNLTEILRAFIGGEYARH